MAKTGRSAEVVFDTRDLERAAKIAEDCQQLSAIPILGLAGEKGVVNLVIAKADPNSLRATGDYRQLNLSREDKDLLASLTKQAGGGAPAVVGLIRPQGQIEVKSELAGRALADNDVLKLDGGELDLLNTLAQQISVEPKLTVVVSDTPLGPKMAVWKNAPDRFSSSQPQIVPLGRRRS